MILKNIRIRYQADRPKFLLPQLPDSDLTHNSALSVDIILLDDYLVNDTNHNKTINF